MEIATKAIRLTRDWTETQNLIKRIDSLPRKKKYKQKHQTETRMTTCKTDAAFNKQKLRAAMAWIFTDPSGSCVKQGSMTQDFVSTPLIAEALAICFALLSAVNLEITSLSVFSDNETLFRAINNDTKVKEIFGIVKEIQQISSVFVGITFSHISRLSNTEAYRLAKHALSLSPSFVCNGFNVG